MKKYILIVSSLLFCSKLLSQINGKYRGLFTYKNSQLKIIGERDTIIDGKVNHVSIAQKVEWNGEKNLVLNSNGVYHFEYWERGAPCAARDSKRMCNGKYRKKGDTLYLTSTYRQTDFYRVVEKSVDTIPKGKIMIVTNYPDNGVKTPKTFINGFELKLNDSLIGEFEINDTVFCAAPEVNNLFFSCCSPYQMEWSYTPKNSQSNYFEVNLIREIEGETIYMDDCKLVKNKRNLIVLGNEYLGIKDNTFKKY